MKNYLIYGTSLIVSLLCSCGTTKVSVSKPEAGTMTTITVTTNNPITTQVNPTTEATIKMKGNEQ